LALTETERLKEQAAEAAVALVEPGMVVGLGTGSTARYALLCLGRLLKEGALRDIVGIPSSRRTEEDARRLGIPLTTLDRHPAIDLTIDGADEVDPELNLIKGGGGALLREKILAQASRRTVIIVDEGKIVPRLGARMPVPVEVVRLAVRPEENYLRGLGAKVSLRLEEGGRAFISDEGNFILDCDFGPIGEPGALASKLNERAGVVEHGLFIGLASEVVVAGREGVRRLGPRQ